MKSILEILILIKKNLEQRKENGQRVISLCGSVEFLSCYRVFSRQPYSKETLSEEEVKIFQEYYRRSKRGQKWFYTHRGFKTTHKDQFAWPCHLKQPRLDWLNHNIKRLQNG